MATTQDLIADGNTEVAKLNQMTAGKGYSQLPKLSQITPGNITDNPVPIETKPSEVLSGTQKALIDNQTRTQVEQPDQFTQAANNQAQQLKTAEVTAFEDYITSVLEAPTFSEVQNQVYGEAGVDALKAEVNRLNSEMLNEQDALRTKIEKIQREGGGLKSGAQAEIANLERESLAKQADIALLQIAATGQWEVAQEAADRAVNAMFEREEKMADVRKEVYNRTKDQWSLVEQRAFEIAEGNRERRLLAEKEQAKLTQDTKIQAMQMLQLNGALTPELSRTLAMQKTPEGVVAVAGQAGVTDLLSREQLRASVANSWASYDLNKLKLEEAQLAKDRIEQALANGEVILDSDQKDLALKLSKEYEDESGEFKKQVGAYNRIIASAEDPSAAGDLALIFNYMKMLDPGSTVREGEFANAQNSAGVPARIISQYNSVISGERLADSTRNDFVSRSQKIYTSSLEQQIALEERYRDKTVNLFGLPESAADMVIQDIRAQGALSETAFSLTFDNLSTDQLLDLQQRGLIQTNNNSTPYYGTQ